MMKNPIQEGRASIEHFLSSYLGMEKQSVYLAALNYFPRSKVNLDRKIYNL